MSALHSFRELLVDELRDLYDAEHQLLKALPKMAEAATDDELKQGFTQHLEQTKTHVSRLEQALGILEVTAKGKTCRAMKGLVEEGSEAIEVKASSPVRDADLIGAAQRVEHYEMAAYGTARSFAETLGENDVASLLQQTLDEESETNQKLNTLAERINDEANSAAVR